MVPIKPLLKKTFFCQIWGENTQYMFFIDKLDIVKFPPVSKIFILTFYIAQNKLKSRIFLYSIRGMLEIESLQKLSEKAK